MPLMSRRDELKLVHIVSTLWFILCVGFLLVLALRQAGANWLIVFSLSGHGFLIVLVLVSLYLFAIYRGISSSQNVQPEHPLTTTRYYAGFYVTTPLLGSLAGFLGMIGAGSVSRFLTGIAMGTLGVTFFVWVVVDPALGLLELLLPTSRKHRARRLAENRALKEQRQRERDALLARALSQGDSERRGWHEVLHPQAEALARLLTEEQADRERAEREAVGIGVDAWRTGGLTCMKELHNMAITLSRKNDPKADIVDHITHWWDGIGTWRTTPLA